jgi:hypothetical protein
MLDRKGADPSECMASHTHRHEKTHAHTLTHTNTHTHTHKHTYMHTHRVLALGHATSSFSRKRSLYDSPVSPLQRRALSARVVFEAGMRCLDVAAAVDAAARVPLCKALRETQRPFASAFRPGAQAGSTGLALAPPTDAGCNALGPGFRAVGAAK